jgi:hypothetical protein
MKSIKAIAAALIVAALAACGGTAHAQAIASAQVVTGPSTTMDIASARYVDVTPGAQTITDSKGVVHSVQLVNPTAVTGSEAYRGYAPLTAYKAINLRAAASVKCVGSSTVVDWYTGGAEVIADGCALQSQVQAVARR